MLQRKFYFFGYLSVCLIIVFPVFGASDKEAEKLDETIRSSISIDRMTLPLVFQSSDISSQLQKMILSDLERILGYGGYIKWQKYSGKKQIGSHRITHKLGNEWEKEWFPEILRRELWAGVTINEKVHLVIPEKLINIYREKMTIKKENTYIIKKLKTFIGTLNNKEELKTLAENPKKSKIRVYFFRIKPFEITNPELYERIFLPLTKKNVSFVLPSIIDIYTLENWFAEWWGEEASREKSFTPKQKKALIALTPLQGTNHDFKWPLIFIKGEWHILQTKWL